MSEAFVICNTCLGNGNNVKMKRQNNGEECRFCTRPFTILRWSGDSTASKMKKTVICETCARARNCCQSCSIDIDYQIPLDLRDAALKLAGLENPYSVENTSKNKEVRAIFGDKLEKQVKKRPQEDVAEKNERMRAVLTKLAEKLGSQAPKPSVVKAQSSGASKEVSKMISNLPFGGLLAQLKIETDRTFFVFGFGPDTPQYQLSEFFEAQGELESTKIIHRARCGYITYKSRSDAERLAEFVGGNGLNSNPSTAGLAIVGNQPIRIAWGNPLALGKNNDDQNKIALVVGKVMKQLAERDAQKLKRPLKQGGIAPSKRQKTTSIHNDSKDGSEKLGVVKYKALSKDIEL